MAMSPKRRMAAVCLLAVILQLQTNVWAVGTSAQSAILMDVDSGRVLYEQNADEPRLIASITKIMTAVVALENCPLDRPYCYSGGYSGGLFHVPQAW